MDLQTVTAVTTALTALVGAYVAGLAYRGYRRNDSRPMGMLAAGVLFVAVVPYAVTHVVAPLFALSDAQTILGVTLSHTLGLLAVYRSLG